MTHTCKTSRSVSSPEKCKWLLLGFSDTPSRQRRQQLFHLFIIHLLASASCFTTSHVNEKKYMYYIFIHLNSSLASHFCKSWNIDTLPTVNTFILSFTLIPRIAVRNSLHVVWLHQGASKTTRTEDKKWQEIQPHKSFALLLCSTVGVHLYEQKELVLTSIAGRRWKKILLNHFNCSDYCCVLKWLDLHLWEFHFKTVVSPFILQSSCCLPPESRKMRQSLIMRQIECIIN